MRSKCAIRRADRGGGLGADVPAPEAGAGGGVEGTLGNGPRAERGMPPLIVDVAKYCKTLADCQRHVFPRIC